jgi:hypothetical protein
MNHLRVQARLALGALLTAVLVLTVAPATSSAAPSVSSEKPSTTVRTERSAAPAKAQPAAAPDARRGCRPPNCYGAITMNMRTLKTFYGYNYGSRYNAERSQYKRCTRSASNPRNCKKITWVRNGCAAVGWKDKPDNTGAYWYAWATKARTGKQARQAVLRKLNYGQKAEVLAWICTARNY